MALPFGAAIKAASTMQEVMAKFDTVFSGNATAMKAWGDDFAGQVGRSQRQIAQFLAGTQDLFVPLGFATDAATQMSKQIVKLAVDLGSFNNVADDRVLTDLQAALTGSGEVMKKYGVLVSEAAVKQQLLKQGMDPKAATDQQKVMARMTIIMAGTTAAQGDAVRTAGSFANRMKALKGNIEDTAAVIGNALLPFATKLVEKVTAIVKVVAKWAAANIGAVQTAAMVVAGIFAAGAAFVTIGTSALLLASTLGLVSSGFTSVAAAVGFILSPIGLVTVAVAGLGAWLLTSTKAGGEAVDWLGGRFRGLLDVVGDTFGAIVNAIKAGDIQAAMEVVTSSVRLVWLKLKTWLVEVWQGFTIFWSGLTTGLASTMLNVTAAIQTAWASLIGWLTKAWETWKVSTFEEGLADALAPMFARIQGVTTEETRKALKEDFARGRESLPDRLGAIDAETKAKQDAITAENKLAQDLLNADKQRSDLAAGKAVSDAQKELDAARKTRDLAITAAKEARNIGPGKEGTPFPGMPMPDIPGVTAAMSSNIKGTFKGSELSGLGAKSPAERTAKAVEKLLAVTDRLLDIDENLLREQKRLTLEATA